MRMLIATLTAIALMTSAASACAPAPSCWLTEGPAYVKSVCSGYAKDKRTKADIRDILAGDEAKPNDVDNFFAACKKQGITFKDK